jgi:hypothetical protein
MSKILDIFLKISCYFFCLYYNKNKGLRDIEIMSIYFKKAKLIIGAPPKAGFKAKQKPSRPWRDGSLFEFEINLA